MHVVPIAQYRARDTVAVLKFLLEQAESGILNGVAVCALHTDGEEDVMFTDAYKRKPRTAGAAASRMFWQAMQSEDMSEAVKRG